MTGCDKAASYICGRVNQHNCFNFCIFEPPPIGCGRKLCLGHVMVRYKDAICFGKYYVYHHCRYNKEDVGKRDSDNGGDFRPMLEPKLNTFGIEKCSDSERFTFQKPM